MNVKPKFAQIGGFTGGVSAVLLTSLDYTSDIGKFAFVGTNSGKCILFCFSSYKRLSTVLGVFSIKINFLLCVVKI